MFLLSVNSSKHSINMSVNRENKIHTTSFWNNGNDGGEITLSKNKKYKYKLGLISLNQKYGKIVKLVIRKNSFFKFCIVSGEPLKSV